MLWKSFIAYASLLCFTTSVAAHCLIVQPLGVSGPPTRNDVQNPTAAKPCGNANIAQTLDTTTPIPANSNGSVSTNITSFNGGADGSRKVQTVQVDPSGTGNNFVAATMLLNGDPNPTNAGTQQIDFQLPANTSCTGGTSKNLCLVSLKTTAGFGNCIVVQDSTASGNGTANGLPQDKAGKKDNSSNTKSNTTTADNNKGANCTNTKTGDKKKGQDSANSQASRRSLDRIASFKRSWSSRDWVKAL